MASITNVRLDIDANVLGPNPTADVEITYDITWDDFDQASNQLYQEHWKLIGADRGAGEDGVDDYLTGRGAAEIVRFSSNGQPTTLNRQIVISGLDLSELDEDATGTDEVRAVVTLTPVGPFSDSEESHRVVLTV
jgi:hypothetical protein